MMYNSGKKILHLCMSGKKFYHQRFGKQIITQSKSLIAPFPPNPQKSNGRLLRTFLSARLAHNVFIVSLPA